MYYYVCVTTFVTRNVGNILRTYSEYWLVLPSFTACVLGLLNVKLREGGDRVLPKLCRIRQFINTDYRQHSELRIRPKSRRVHNKKCNEWLTDYCVPGNAVPTVKMTLGTPFPGVPAGNDPWTWTGLSGHWRWFCKLIAYICFIYCFCFGSRVLD